MFFFHGSVARDVADAVVLQNGEIFARRLAEIFTENGQQAQLAHIATDGETYGHHHRHTDMALAYCIHYIESNNLAKITVYGEYLEKFPPTCEVEIYENTSWSCGHGIQRWTSSCGCCYGKHPSGQQQWREPLRKGMDWLRDQLAPVYEKKMSQYDISDPWALRNSYISVILNRSIENVESFLCSSTSKELSHEQKVTFLKLLEMQRNAMLMYTSCGWFFDDICGIEAIQIMQYAARAIQLAKEVNGKDFEPGFKDIIQEAPANAKEFANGREAYEVFIKPVSIDLNRVGAHLAVSSIFEKYPDKIDIYCYSANIGAYKRIDAGIQTLATGRATIQSNITLEKHPVDFAVLHFGDHNLIGAVNARMSDDAFFSTRKNLEDAFAKGDTTEVMRLMNVCFRGNSYSLWDLFKDQQRCILYRLLETTWQEIEASFRLVYEHNYTIMQAMRGMGIPFPKALSASAEFILNQDLCKVIQDDESDLGRLQELVDEATRLSVQLDQATLRFEASRKINRLMNKLAGSPDDLKLLETIEATLGILRTIVLELDLQTAQNVLFAISRGEYPAMSKKAELGDSIAKKWVEHFEKLADYLDVKVR